MIKTILYNSSTGETRWGGKELFADWKQNPELFIWADFDNEETQQEGLLFQNIFGLHSLAIADSQRERHPPKLEAFDDYFFLLILGLDKSTRDIDFKTIPISFFVGQKYFSDSSCG